MVTAADIVRLDASAVRASVQIVSRAGSADLTRSTPCAGCTLVDLLAHMTAQHHGFAAGAAGDGADLVRWQTGAPAACATTWRPRCSPRPCRSPGRSPMAGLPLSHGC